MTAIQYQYKRCRCRIYRRWDIITTLYFLRI